MNSLPWKRSYLAHASRSSLSTALFFIIFSTLALLVAPCRANTPLTIQAHRGFSSKYPENTMLAFRKAVEGGANRVETDLWISADGVPILLHDRMVDRTTNGQGNADEMTLAQIRKLDAGSWKDPSFKRERIPTVEEALEFALQKNVEFNLEIKANKDRPPETLDSLIEKTVALVQEKHAEDVTIFSSFSLKALLKVRKWMPEARLILLDWTQADTGLGKATENSLYGFSPHPKQINVEIVQAATEAGIKVFVRGAANQQTLDACAWGVAGFANDDPSLLADFLKKNGIQ